MAMSASSSYCSSFSAREDEHVKFMNMSDKCGGGTSASGHYSCSSSLDNFAESNDWEMSPTKYLARSKETMVLIEETCLLEDEVTDLEQRILTFYRNFFSQYIMKSPFSQTSKMTSSTLTEDESKRKYSIFSRVIFTPSSSPSSLHRHDASITTLNLEKEKSLLSSNTRDASLSSKTSNVNHKSYSLEHQSSPRVKDECKDLSLIYQNSRVPLTLKDYFYKSPNRLSEELVRCMSAIYCKLSNPPLKHSGVVLSPPSSASSTSINSPHDVVSDGWSPRWKTESFSDTLLKDPYKVKGDMGDAGPYTTMVEIPWICVDKDRLSCATLMLRNFRSMVEHLEKVDPTSMQQHARLAFWINVYNALVMHAYLAYGIPDNNLRRLSLFQRAAYKVGGYSLSATAIEQSILCRRTARPAQWLQRLLSTGTRLKAGEERRTFGRIFGLDVPEPLVWFAICSGGYSDPALRVYTEKNVINELEVAKREFLVASIGIQNNRKVSVPKLIECYAKEAGMSSGSVLDWVCQNVDDTQREAIRALIERNPQKTAAHCIEWLPYNYNFRYIFARDLVVKPA
ncbi:uncharacterized protein LOC131060376 isoform X2 [Cryptomeria japonica]|uniref:uncharacterized protein LOC131060376 isoform X2 n=1 Tax=Cryptomeria japonica TaxID=3369 RepID=UPI0027DAAD4C|nr:uncharacterized protein LOC131060376 isoform X2 [Cryptomeria japonica]